MRSRYWKYTVLSFIVQLVEPLIRTCISKLVRSNRSTPFCRKVETLMKAVGYRISGLITVNVALIERGATRGKTALEGLR